MGLEQFTGLANEGQVVAHLPVPTPVVGRTASGTTLIPLIYVGERNGRPCWKTVGEVRYFDDVLGCTFVVPDGYEFDLATIPRSVWWLIAPFELSTLAALIHDWLYEFEGKPTQDTCQPQREFTREEVDDLFLRLMTVEGVSRFRRNLAWLAVRSFGWSFWDSL